MPVTRLESDGGTGGTGAIRKGWTGTATSDADKPISNAPNDAFAHLISPPSELLLVRRVAEVGDTEADDFEWNVVNICVRLRGFALSTICEPIWVHGDDEERNV
ncbi:hypothetical protein CGCF413_v007062 [Colletotrichum fructicola]|nr:hypothetical protein CGCF413_v007062 [Colletotrichum fructicola]